MNKIYLHRKLTDEIIKWFDRKEIIAIRGPRQSGKTTLLNILKNYLIERKNIPEERIIYITLEDRDILEQFSSNPKEYIQSFISKDKENRYYFLIDEVHYLKNAGQVLKLLYDIYQNIKFIITGSSSLELTSHTGKYLVGRIFLFNLYQFSFEEFLEAKSKNLYNTFQEKSSSLHNFIYYNKEPKEKVEIFNKDFNYYFEQYAIFGGFPEIVKSEDIETKKIILKNIYNTYITRDIIELLRIGEVSNFRTIVTLLANQIGCLLNYNSLATNSKSYFRQIRHYLSILEETFIIKQIKPFFKNKVTELKKNPKVYFLDTGLRNYIINNFNLFGLRADVGALIENIVLLQILYGGVEMIRYWRTTSKVEVDFVLEVNNEILPVEIKYIPFKQPNITRGFRNFIETYKPERALVLTRDYWGKLKINKTKIIFAPVWYIR